MVMFKKFLHSQILKLRIVWYLGIILAFYEIGDKVGRFADKISLIVVQAE